LEDVPPRSTREAREAVRGTDAGRKLEALRDGPHARERARDWQERLLRERSLERLEHSVRLEASTPKGRCSWLEGYLERLEGKEARAAYYALLEEETVGSRG
jgi:hypothetical protein